MSVREAQSKICGKEFIIWCEFLGIDALGQDRLDMMFAQVCQVLMAVNGKSTSITEWLIRQKPQTVDDIAGYFAVMAQQGIGTYTPPPGDK